MKFYTALLTLLICMLLVPAIALGAEAEKPIQLYMNEKLLTPEVAPKIVNGNTIVPVRIIAEEIGAKVTWDGQKRAVAVTKGDMNIQLTIDKKDALIKGAKANLEVAPVIIDGNTMLPLRFIGEQLGVKFNWDGLTRSVHMFKQAETASIKQPAAGQQETGTVSEGAKQPSGGGKDSAAEQPAGEKGGSGTGAVKPGPSASPTPSPTPSPSPSAKPVPGAPASPAGEDAAPAPLVLQSIEMSDTGFTVKAKEGELQPNGFKLANPGRIVFDFPNAILDEALQKLLVNNLGELPSKHPLVEKIRFSNFSDKPATVRIILDLKENADYRAIQPAKQKNQWSAAIESHKLRVVIDPGHGAKDPGALSITGKQEKDFTLALAKKVTKLLSEDKRLEVLITRTDDTFIELDDRVSFANENQADLFLSIHGNKYNSNIRGVETYYNRPDSVSFANLIHKNTLEATGFPDRKVREADFRVIKYTTMPAVLVEVGYLSNKTDEESMFKEEFQNQVAASLVSAIKEYLNIK